MSAPKPWERSKTALNSSPTPDSIIVPSQSTTAPVVGAMGPSAMPQMLTKEGPQIGQNSIGATTSSS